LEPPVIFIRVGCIEGDCSEMTNTQLAELFLLRLYDIAEVEDYSKRLTLNEIAAELGVADAMKIINVAKFLERRGFIDAKYSVGGSVRAAITGEGAIFVEAGGETGVINEYRQHPENYRISIDQSTHFHGSVSGSNVAVHSTDLNQGSAISPQVELLISAMAEAIRADTAISELHRSEHLNDVATLRAELKREQPRRSIIEALLSQLGDLASVGSLAAQLHQYLPQVPDCWVNTGLNRTDT
jgi:hypothetical protein